MRFDLTINEFVKKYILMKNLTYIMLTLGPYLNLSDLASGIETY